MKAGRSKKTLLTMLLVVLLIFSSVLIFLKVKHPTTSPLKALAYTTYGIFHPHEKLTKDVIGFLPYWRISDIGYIQHNLLSEVIFFSLTPDENGNIIKVVGNETEPGWRWWSSQTVKDEIVKTQILGGKFSVSVAMLKNLTVENFLTTPSAKKTLISNLLTIVQESHVDGLNLDFEYTGALSDESLREEFTRFVSDLRTEFKNKSPNTEISIDLNATAVRTPRLFDVAQIVPLVDKVVVMSYGYYGSSSEIAGPGAPMGGLSEGKYFFDVATTYNDFLQAVPKEKIIMGVPYYAWDYPVEDGNTPMSKTLPQNDENGYPSVMSYGRMRTVKDINPANCKWDDLAKEYFCSYLDSSTGKFHQVWIEDSNSLGVKYDFAKSKNLAGIAIWTLGYDKPYSDLWNLIKTKFTIQ